MTVPTNKVCLIKMDVSKKNYYNILPDLLADIKNSSFIAVDSEFTGLTTNKSFKRSYFDSGASLYEKEFQNLENVSICQIGISVFKGQTDCNKYLVKTYNIYICPQSLLTFDDSILCQVSSLDFLKDCHFDFTKWIVDGVPCLNKAQEWKVRQSYADLLAGQLPVNLPYEVIDELEDVRSWSKNAAIGDRRTSALKKDTNTLFLLGLLHTAGINVTPSYENGKIRLTKTESKLEEVQRDSKNEAERALDLVISRQRGFILVFEELVRAKVPLILHNGILDLILMYKQFHGLLPTSYFEFKRKVHEMFPLIYDTKQLAFILRLKMRSKNNNETVHENLLRDTSLQKVKADLEEHMAVLHRPLIEHGEETAKYSDGTPYPHEAGYDAFCTGYCFLHISHIFTMNQLEKVEYQRPLSARELIYSMKEWSNELPVQRAGIKYISLDGGDPEVNKFSWLVVESRNPCRALSPEAVANFLSPLGNLSVVRRNKRSVLVASPKVSLTEDVIRALRENELLRVSRYRRLRHSLPVRSLAWTCALLSTGLCTWLLVKTFKKL